jgi:anti-sigma B factor antagonist
MLPVQPSVEHEQRKARLAPQGVLASQSRASRTEVAPGRRLSAGAVADTRDAAGALSLRLSAEPWTHFARLTGEVAGEPAHAIVKFDGSVLGDAAWLQRAAVREQGATGDVEDGPLERTFSLSRSCDRLLHLELLDVGHQYAPLARGARGCASEYMERAEAVEIASADEILRITKAQNKNTVRLFLEGELDFGTCPGLLAFLKEAFDEPCFEIVLDISALDFIDSTGMSLFVTAHKRAASDGRRLVVSLPTPRVLRTLQIVGLTDFFNFESS